MAVTASIKFTQGGNTAVAGQAVEGNLTDGTVTVTNGDNLNVSSWEMELVDTPPGSAVTKEIFATGISSTPSGSFDQPDLPGAYRVKLTVREGSGNFDTDVRNLVVRNFRGHVSPPYQKNPDPIDIVVKADELNVGGQAYGWAGDGNSGLLRTFFSTYEDVPSAVVTATPFTAEMETATLWLVNTTTIAATSIFNLPASPRDGQVFTILDNQNDAFTYPISVTLPGGNQFEDGTSVRRIFANGGLMKLMKLTGTSWRILQNTNREEYIPIFSGQKSTANNNYQRLASFNFNPDNFPVGARYVFEVIAETTNASNPIEIQLENQTLTAIVSTPLSSISLVPQLRTDTLVSPADLAAGDNVYELQFQMTSGSGPDEATCSGARIRMVYATTS